MNPLELRIQELEQTVQRILRAEDIGFIKSIERKSSFATEADLAALSLSSLTDVSATAPSSGQVLKFNGTIWAPGTDIDT